MSYTFTHTHTEHKYLIDPAGVDSRQFPLTQTLQSNAVEHLQAAKHKRFECDFIERAYERV